MSNFSKILSYVRNPKIFFLNLCSKNIIPISDEKYLKLLFSYKMHKELELNSPSTFNEKLQWLKLYNRKKEYTDMVDKFEVKKYITNIIGEEYIIPTIGVWNRFEDIDFENLPKQFVIKCTHDSGGIIICEDKEKFNYSDARKKINKLLKRNYYYTDREWPYKNIKPRIIIEEYMKDNTENDLKDYKFFCFNGKVETILVCSNKTKNDKNTDFYDCNWNLLPFTREKHTNNPSGIQKPKHLEEMVEIAKKLSQDIPFVRVDLYEINGKVYFGELTFFPSAGFEGFNPPEYDKILGDLLILPEEKRDGNEK